MTHNREQRPTPAGVASQMFESFFLGGAAVASVGAEPTVGPLAKESSAPAARAPSHVTRTEDAAFTGKTAAQKATVTPAGTPRNKRGAEATVKNALAQPDLSESSGPGTSAPISANSVTGGTAPYTGSDVGSLPGPVMDPMTTDSAPAKGKRGPSAAEISKLMAAGIKGRLRSKAKGAPVPVVTSSGEDVDEKVKRNQPGGDDGNRMTTTLSGPNGPEIHTGGGREKIGSLLITAGIPPSLVGEDSVIFQFLTEKVAKVMASPASDAEVALFTRDDSHPLAIWGALGARYGDTWLSWDTEVVAETLAQDIGRAPSAAAMNKIAALQIVSKDNASHAAGSFSGDWHVFEKVCVALDGHTPHMTLVEDLSPEQMALGVSIMRGVAPSAVYNANVDIRRYCAARLFDAGLVVAPPELGFCDEDLAKLSGDSHADLRAKSMVLYRQALAGEEPRDVDVENPTPDFVQASRLLRIHAYVIDRLDDLVRQLA